MHSPPVATLSAELLKAATIRRRVIKHIRAVLSSAACGPVSPPGKRTGAEDSDGSDCVGCRHAASHDLEPPDVEEL